MNAMKKSRGVVGGSGAWQRRYYTPTAIRRSWSGLTAPGPGSGSVGKIGAFRNSLKVSEEVTDALATNKPVVALESTIYTHGALGDDLDLEGIVRRNGGVPAVCGILEGMPTVGLLPNEITHMIANSPQKVSRRDIAFLTGMVCSTSRSI